jgi:TetR/AcrR family transcriptional repressor of nem operon
MWSPPGSILKHDRAVGQVVFSQLVSTFHPTKVRLMDAAVELAEEGGFGQLSINEVVGRAGVGKGTFYVHFADRSAMLVAVHRRFYDEVITAIANSVVGHKLGVDRLIAGATVYLDACLQGRAVKALLVEARSDPALAVAMGERDQEFATLAEPNFAALNVRESMYAARLFVGLAAAAALVELESGERLDGVRIALADYVCERDLNRHQSDEAAPDP